MSVFQNRDNGPTRTLQWMHIQMYGVYVNTEGLIFVGIMWALVGEARER